MKRIPITGMSGVGVSTVLEELAVFKNALSPEAVTERLLRLID